jgi:hypothetical protein
LIMTIFCYTDASSADVDSLTGLFSLVYAAFSLYTAAVALCRSFVAMLDA